MFRKIYGFLPFYCWDLILALKYSSCEFMVEISASYYFSERDALIRPVFWRDNPALFLSCIGRLGLLKVFSYTQLGSLLSISIWEMFLLLGLLSLTWGIGDSSWLHVIPCMMSMILPWSCFILIYRLYILYVWRNYSRLVFAVDSFSSCYCLTKERFFFSSSNLKLLYS